MRQERIRKTQRRRQRRVEPQALNLTPHTAGPSDADDLLDRIDQVLESA